MTTTRPALVRALRGPLGHIPLIPTGGVDAGNPAGIMAAGAAAAAVGGRFTAGSDAEAESLARVLLTTCA